MPAHGLSTCHAANNFARPNFSDKRQVTAKSLPATRSPVDSPKDPFAQREVYRDSLADRAAIWLFSAKLKQQLGDRVTGKEYAPGFEGFVELSKEILKGRSTDQQRQVIKNVLASLLPEAASTQFRRLFPLSQWSAEVNARITTIGFFWLVGEMELQNLDVQHKGVQETWRSSVLIKKCRYLETSGCKAMCVNMCKRPTQEFFTDQLGLPLTMVPNFEDLSCEMKFGIAPPEFKQDDVYNEPCFSHVCSLGREDASRPCPKMDTERWKAK